MKHLRVHFTFICYHLCPVIKFPLISITGMTTVCKDWYLRETMQWQSREILLSLNNKHLLSYIKLYIMSNFFFYLKPLLLLSPLEPLACNWELVLHIVTCSSIQFPFALFYCILLFVLVYNLLLYSYTVLLCFCLCVLHYYSQFHHGFFFPILHSGHKISFFSFSYIFFSTTVFLCFCS